MDLYIKNVEFDLVGIFNTINPLYEIFSASTKALNFFNLDGEALTYFTTLQTLSIDIFNTTNTSFTKNFIMCAEHLTCKYELFKTNKFYLEIS